MGTTNLPGPDAIKSECAVSASAVSAVLHNRAVITQILTDETDERILVVLGPCSIHSYTEAVQYANHVLGWRDKFADKLEIVMRCYFEKPRTRGGWKGLVYDPFIDGGHDISSGISLARRVLAKISNSGVPIAHELLDPVTPVFFGDLISWGAIGARTVESQVHRQLASDSPYPVGFKNSTNGNVQVAVDAIVSASQPHYFIGVNDKGGIAGIASSGNRAGHLILRGGETPNFYARDVEGAQALLKAAAVTTGIILDCSHGNSGKDYKRQEKVVDYLIEQHLIRKNAIRGIMLESNLAEGRQAPGPLSTLKHGVSITDGCMGLAQTEVILEKLAGSR